MTPSVLSDTWIPQVWSHADIVAMQAGLDPARITEMADHWRRLLDDAREVLRRLEADVSRHLSESWQGEAGRRALDELRAYISEALDGLTRFGYLAEGLVALSDAAAELRASVDGLDHETALAEVRSRYSEPAVAAGNAVGEIPWSARLTGAPGNGGPMPALPLPAVTTPSPIPTVPSGAGTDFGDVTAPTSLTGAQPPRPTALDAQTALPSNAPVIAATPSGASVPTASALPARPTSLTSGMPYGPFMGGAYPAALAREDTGTRRTPGYLISIDNGNELIGPLPKVAPPVLGDW
jgi:hypothetical protein